MRRAVRSFARRVLGVRRTPTYYLPWLGLPGLECVLLLSNVEARFKAGYQEGPFPAVVVQYDERGRVVGRYQVDLPDAVSTVEVPLAPGAGGAGFVTVTTERIHSDLYVTLSDGETYTATHGRREYVERYPAWTRALLALGGAVLALAGRTIPAFVKDQYLYVGAESRSHLLVLNLSNVTNRVRVRVSANGRALATRHLTLPPMGSHLLDVSGLAVTAGAMSVVRARLEANAWFNFYLVGAGPRDLAGPLSLMHVK